MGVGVATGVAAEEDHPWVDEEADRPWAAVAPQWVAVAVDLVDQVVEALVVVDPCEVDPVVTEATEERDHTRNSGLWKRL